ncbi:MAG TPA: VWA domain-containing protein [Pyrinomonadaceae bacterium]|nr:VWA domain-containing protein [Pyrinomonadaceae bacterium]
MVETFEVAAARARASMCLALAVLMLVGVCTHTLRAQANGGASVPPQPSKAAAPPQQQDEEEVERVESDLTNILFTAIDRNRRFVTTLKQEDLRVLENGVPQQVFTFQRETDLPLSLAVVIDLSRSQEQTLADEKTAARAFVDRVMRPAKDNFAVVSFTGKPLIEQGLTAERASLHAAIERLKVELPEGDPECENVHTVEDDARCWSGIWDALWATTNQVLSQTPERTRRAVILLSDGDDTSSGTKKDELIDFAIKSNSVFYSIGIGDRDNYDIDEGALKKISERTGGRAFFPESKEQLEAAFAQIEQELRSQYLVAYSSSNKKQDGTFRRVQIDITNPTLRKEKLRLLYRQGYYARGAATAVPAPAAKK